MKLYNFILPNLNRKMFIYWDTATRKCNIIGTEKVFEGDNYNLDNNNGEHMYLLLLMKLRMGLSVIDLGERFCVTDSTVNNTFLTWIN